VTCSGNVRAGQGRGVGKDTGPMWPRIRDLTRQMGD